VVKVGKAGDMPRGYKPGVDLPGRPEYLPPAAPQPPPKNEWTGPVTVATVLRKSNEYGINDVLKLKAAVERNTKRPIRFVCLTDSPEWEFPEDVEVAELMHPSWVTKQSKLEMFRSSLIEDWGRTLYMDLDTVICGPIDRLLCYDGEFAMLGDFADPFRNTYGSGLMAWAPSFGSSVYEAFIQCPESERLDTYRVGGGRGDQLFIRHHTPLKPHLWQEMFPGQVVSYKGHCRYGFQPREARVICFHGRPKLKDIEDQWILDHYK